MKKIFALILLVAVVVGATGCKSNHSGSREYVPGKGWLLND